MVDTKITWSEAIKTNIDAHKDFYIEVSHAIHDRPEIGNEEFYASEKLATILEKAGFTVELDVAGHKTAFIARKKAAKPGATVAFLAEYDALPGLGHACGHNIIGTTSVAAAIALAEVIEEVGGEVVVLGTPAEEGGPNGSAKGSFVKHHLLQGIDAALMIHPSSDSALTTPSLAVDVLEFEFFGKPAHSAANPEDGINALDGLIQFYNGVNALRQHVTSDVRIHGIILDGGQAPNIVPDYARARFFTRADKRHRLDEVTKRVIQVAEGAAIQTGTTFKVTNIQNGVDDFLINKQFNRVFARIAEQLDEPLKTDSRGIGSTDAGNISQVIPTIHPYIKIGASNLVGHTVEFREAAKSEAGDKALIKGAKLIALTALELYTNETLLADIKKEYDETKQI
ncbi:M20 family metallopeptidase [Listeria grandensis]|uniref:Peptidase M20 domain-containing protein 2 n=1 Tax=Listeria grandensis TaxID=1494963 RepID=A0A7X0Y2K8_9LIST|nr:M20 family metallopeptidase [Listeria grandensis]MBC1935568.1 M20 family metallopeptidase [Listeria grandensis]